MQLRQGGQGTRFRLRRLAAPCRTHFVAVPDSVPGSSLSRRELILGTLVFLGFLSLFLLKAPGMGFYFSEHVTTAFSSASARRCCSAEFPAATL